MSQRDELKNTLMHMANSGHDHMIIVTFDGNQEHAVSCISSGELALCYMQAVLNDTINAARVKRMNVSTEQMEKPTGLKPG